MLTMDKNQTLSLIQKELLFCTNEYFYGKSRPYTVLIPDKTQSRYTICLSVSVGCYLSCEFCATAQISKKLVRNLSPGEIISQVILCKVKKLKNFLTI